MSTFRLSAEPLDPAALRAQLETTRAGAVLVFEGTVRDHHQGRSVLGLSYQAYAELAEHEGRTIIDEALARHAIVAAFAVHRVGDLELGEVAVWVGVAAAHREAAYEASRWLIDEIKRRVPIWKRERYATGDSEWLHP